jgi:hypothetical protein
MGIVWLAWDERLGREVALKEVVFPDHLTEEQRRIRIRRSLREARSAVLLRHTSVIDVHDVIEEDGRPWIVMEYFPGRSLADILDDDGPLPPESVARIGIAVVDALAAAHERGIVHRDVKPGNVLINESGKVVLTDFGIAAVEGETTITRQGSVLGTPAYMAPEQARGEAATPASDLWALGATLFAAVEGHPPHGGPDAGLTRAGPLAPVINGLLRKEPRQRLTADETARLLARIDRPRPSRRRLLLIATAVVIVAAAAVLVPWALPDGDKPTTTASSRSPAAPTTTSAAKSSPAKGAVARLPQPCTMVKAEHVRALIPEPKQEDQRTSTLAICTYTSGGAKFQWLRVEAYLYSDSDEAVQRFQADWTQAQHSTLERTLRLQKQSGLGDEAFQWYKIDKAQPTAVAQLTVRFRNVVVNASYSEQQGSGSAAVEQRLVNAAQTTVQDALKSLT